MLKLGWICLGLGLRFYLVLLMVSLHFFVGLCRFVLHFLGLCSFVWYLFLSQCWCHWIFCFNPHHLWAPLHIPVWFFSVTFGSFSIYTSFSSLWSFYYHSCDFCFFCFFVVRHSCNFCFRFSTPVASGLLMTVLSHLSSLSLFSLFVTLPALSMPIMFLHLLLLLPWLT